MSAECHFTQYDAVSSWTTRLFGFAIVIAAEKELD
jgi:hypothetical protein